MRTRKFEESNYSSVFHNGKTLRIALDKNKEITELEYPEFYDLKITNYCSWGCKYCYQSSKPEAHYENIIWKTKQLFGEMTDNQKPYQIAIGWGNPNQHPDFIELCRYLDSIGIMPNYTTNWIWLTPEVIGATKKYCWWVAITCHDHLTRYWSEAIHDLTDQDVKVNLHILISDKASIDKFMVRYAMYQHKVDYFVLLPVMAMWRQKTDVEIDYKYLQSMYPKLDMKKIAFGANFYPYVKDDKLDISLYEPEIMSKYIDLKGEWAIYKSSFTEEPIKTLWLI